jgi:hypothetical protein
MHTWKLVVGWKFLAMKELNLVGKSENAKAPIYISRFPAPESTEKMGI